jgi:hypothetical protein
MDPRVISRSLTQPWVEPPYVPPSPEPAPPPPLTTTELRHRLAGTIAAHKAASDRVTQLELAQSRAQAACRTAFGAVDEAEGLLAEAKEDEPRGYVQRLLSNGDASDHVDEIDIVDAAQRRLAEANRQLRLAQHADEVIAEELVKALNSLTYATMHRDDAVAAVVRSHRAVEKLRADYAKALAKAAELRLALAEIARCLPAHALPNDIDIHSESVVSLRAPRIATDGTVAGQWRDALKRLEADAAAALPGEKDA